MCKKRCEKCCGHKFTVLSWGPVIVETAILIWTYYVYVVAMCIFTSDILVEKIILLTVYHIILFLALWCYVEAIFTPAMKPPAEYKMEESEWSKMTYDFHWQRKPDAIDALRSRLHILTTTSPDGRSLPAYCHHCKNLKPDRCHHCSRCKTCVLKMDHHCPWINNCVGFHNYKTFLLFLMYALKYCIYVILTSIRFIVGFFNDVVDGQNISGDYNRIQIFIMACVLLLIGIAICPLMNLHHELIYLNMTTLENSRPVGMVGTIPSEKTFDLGKKKNFQQVFGRRKCLWCFPVFSSLGDGVRFPLSTESNVEHTDTTVKDEIVYEVTESGLV